MVEEKRSVAKKIDKVIYKAMWGVSVLSGISLFAVALLCTADAFGSKIFSASIPNSTEIITYLNIPVVFFAMAFIQVERGHTTVDLLSGRFPKAVKTAIHLVGYLLGAAICSFVGYCSFRLVLDKLATHAKASASASSFEVWPFALMVVIGFVLVAISFIWCIFREFLIPPSEWAGAMPAPDIENLKNTNGKEDQP